MRPTGDCRRHVVIGSASAQVAAVLNHDLYVEARVPFCLLIDPDTKPAGAILPALDGDEYRAAAEDHDGVLTVTEPFPVRLDLLT